MTLPIGLLSCRLFFSIPNLSDVISTNDTLHSPSVACILTFPQQHVRALEEYTHDSLPSLSEMVFQTTLAHGTCQCGPLFLFEAYHFL